VDSDFYEEEGMPRIAAGTKIFKLTRGGMAFLAEL